MRSRGMDVPSNVNEATTLRGWGQDPRGRGQGQDPRGRGQDPRGRVHEAEVKAKFTRLRFEKPKIFNVSLIQTEMPSQLSKLQNKKTKTGPF